MPNTIFGRAAVVIFGILSIATMTSAAERGVKSESSFQEVWKVVTETPAKGFSKEVDADIQFYEEIKRSKNKKDNPPLPHHSGTLAALWSIFSGNLKAAAVRTVNSHDDYRDYFQKLVHANGVCFHGNWEITEDSPYSGYFKKGSVALIIGRISTAGPDPIPSTKKPRSLGFAGKLFPTTDHSKVVQTANFFTVDDLNGTATPRAVDVSFVNQPPVSFDTPNGKVLKWINDIFQKADEQPGIRPLHSISRAGQSAGSPVVTPKWMRIKAVKQEKLADANDADFRIELSEPNYKNGLTFTIEVAGSPLDRLDVVDVNKDAKWKTIGKIQTKAMNTYFGCDRRLHFPHPKFKEPTA